MLRSQLERHNFLRRRQIFLGELLLVSALFHTVFFFFLLVVYSGYRYSKYITVRRNGSLHPTYCIYPVTMVQPGCEQNTANAKKVTEAITTRVPSTVIKNDTAKKAVTKQQQKKQSIQNKRQSVAQKQKPKEEAKKPQVKQNQKQSKQEVVKKQQSPQKEEKREQKKIDSAQSKEIAAPVQQPAMAFGAGVIPIAERDDFDTLQIEQYIQNEISRYWHSPIGLPDDLTCKIRVQIDNAGMVSDAVIEESSGVLVYDLSARSATNSLSLPCWAWGKEFTINFR
jgi:outer membrane biosynthesis protein TonB